ncbi:hypothetical protein AYO49_06080 [Verrucomicrobiaceae bacterium SCGC AG-212-N21]|nr:hypothetical protein AYO49_06080 [Verrucomicrobiaceae bacterium SCGC AG-212-N21]
MILSLALTLLARWAPLSAGDYTSVKNAQGTFHLYRAHPNELSLHWKGADGHALRTFEAVEKHLRATGKEPAFLMNAGIFEPGGTPSGLHVEDGKEQKAINLADGKGNFYLKPNGVFFIDDQGARILSSDAYAKANLKPRLALQSGPMLLIDGSPHPAFRPASENRLHRNGVGILPDGRVLFIVTDLPSNTRVNLFQFASLFGSYGCLNALFLDGDLSVMAINKSGKLSPVDSADVASRELAPGVPAGHEFGAILAVAPRRTQP